MEVMKLISLPNFSGFSSFPPVLCPQIINHSRGLFSFTVNHQRCNDISIRNKSLRFCAKSSLRGNPEADGVPTSVPVTVAYELLQAGHRYLDVRTSEEFSGGHAPGAINVAYMYTVGSGFRHLISSATEIILKFGLISAATNGEFTAVNCRNCHFLPSLFSVNFVGGTKNPKFLEEVSSYFGKYDEIIVGCQVGKRSIMAATDLLAAGFTSITDVAGGFDAWKQNGLPTEP